MDRDNKKNPVFIVALVICVLLAVWATAFHAHFESTAQAVFEFLTTNFSWLYLLIMLVFVIFSIALACSKWGRVKLGPDDAMPEFSSLSWFAMLFACGKGVGLIFWGIAEPVSHYMDPVAGIDPMSADSARFAFEACFTHWGVHPWANYAVIGLALAYFQFRKGKPALISSVLEPLVGEKLASGWLGMLVDILAIFATIAGIVTSLGLGVMQINGGFEYLFGIPSSLLFQVAVIVAITLIVIATAVSGLDKGIKMISDANLYLAIAVLVVCFLVAPQLDVVNNFVSGIGLYIQDFFTSSLMVNTYGDNTWMLNWRVFYWAWWIAWAPFVGLFIARISKGRTIREFVIGVVLVPALGDILWFSVFGTLGISLGEHGVLSAEVLGQIAAAPEIGLFVVLEQYPLGFILCIVFLVLLFGFFIASANSGTYVLSMLSSKGDLNPPNNRKVLWGAVQAALAIGLLCAGGLKPLQTISIAAAFPFLFVMGASMVSLVKGLKRDETSEIGQDANGHAPIPDGEAADEMPEMPARDGGSR